jgi:hypothetical protein
MGGGSSSTCDCCASFITFCEDTFGTNNCTLCGVDIAATGIEFLGDNLDGSQITFLKEKTLKPIPLNGPYSIIKGILSIDTPSGTTIAKLLQDKTLFTIASRGTFYISGLSNTLVFFRKNLQSFEKAVNVYTSMATSYMIKTSNSDLNIINKLFAQKLGFPISDYNYYMKNYYYDYNKNPSNTYALQLIRVDAIIIFLWHLIYQQAVLNDITIDYPFYIQFYLCMFENLNGTTAILTSQINPYFIKYSPAILPEVDDVAIVKWTEIISQQTDLYELLITKMESRLLSVPELTANSPSIVNSKLSLSSITSRADECFSYRDSIYAKYGLLKTK